MIVKEKEKPAEVEDPQGSETIEAGVLETKEGSEQNELGLKVDASGVKKFLDERVKEAVQDVLQVFLQEEAKALCGAGKYERTAGRDDYRNGQRVRKLVTRVGEVVLKVPRLRELAFTTAIVERYQRRECSIDEALLEMYFAGVSTRRVQDITQALWGGKVSADQMSTLNQKVFFELETWRTRKLKGEWPYVFCDGIVLSRRWADQVQNVSVLVAVGVNLDGRREVIGVAEGQKEDKAGWGGFFRELKTRGLSGVKLLVGDRCLGLVEAAKDVFPEALYQRCTVHFYRNVLSKTPQRHMRELANALKAIHAQESIQEARLKAQRMLAKYGRKFPEAMKVIKDGVEETLSYYQFPSLHWRKIRTTNVVERLNREIRRRTNVVGSFPDGKSAILLVCARLRWVTNRSWGNQRYILMKPAEELEKEEALVA